MGWHWRQLWWDIAQDETRRDSDRLEASKLLADRGWGKAPTFEPLEGDPLDLAALEEAAETFHRPDLEAGWLRPSRTARSHRRGLRGTSVTR